MCKVDVYVNFRRYILGVGLVSPVDCTPQLSAKYGVWSAKADVISLPNSGSSGETATK